VTPEEFWDILHSMPEPSPVFWRLYYNNQGEPVCYSMEDQPGNYIEIDAETFALAPWNVRVVDHKLKYITARTSKKIVPGNTGTLCHPQNVAVIVTQNGTHWSKQTYGLESN
jgi:hypothetical protein